MAAVTKRVPAAPLGHVLLASTEPRVALEIPVDYTCPFCARLFKRFMGEVIPWVNKNAPGQVLIRTITTPQPWHPQGVMLAEAVLAVTQVHPDKYAEYVAAVYAAREEKFIDAKSSDKSRNQLYEEALAIAGEIGLDVAAIAPWLKVDTEGNMGSRITKLLKQYVKYGRKRGFHVTPTVFVNGLEDPKISSGWTLEQWTEYLGNFVGTAGDDKK